MAVKARNKPKAKTIVKKPTVNSGAKKRKQAKYKSFRLHKRIKHPGQKLPNWWKLTTKSLALMRANAKPLFFFFLIYSLLNILLVRGFASSVDVEGVRQSFDELFGASMLTGLASGFTAFGMLIDPTAQTGGEMAQLYQVILLIIASLAIIWLYRQQQAGSKVTMKKAFYRGMFPLVPFTLVAVVIGLQLIPAMIGNFLYTIVLTEGLAVTGLEQVLWLLLFLLTLLLSLYMLTSSTIALYVVTLPEVTPMIALREARELVRHRRFSVMRKVLAAIIILLLFIAIVVLPVIFFAPVLAEWLFFAITVLAVPFVHGYMFSLYRELL